MDSKQPAQTGTVQHGEQTPSHPVPAAQPVVPPDFKKHSSGRGRRIAIIIFSVIAALCIIASVVLFAIFDGLQHVASSCTRQEDTVQAAANALKDRLQTVKINGALPVTVTNTADKDCVDGSKWVSATAAYTFAAPNAQAANAQVMADLGVAPSMRQTFKPGGQGGAIEYLETTLTVNPQTTYKADYYLQVPLTCPGASCDISQAAAIKVYDLLGKPINKLTLTQSNLADNITQ